MAELPKLLQSIDPGVIPSGNEYRRNGPCSKLLYSTPFKLMIALLLLGAFTAFAHHSLYTHLDGRPPQNFAISQIWVVRIGNALAFLFKTTLIASISIAYFQRSWFSIQQKAITLNGLDAIFGILANPMKFFVKEVVLTAPTLYFLALITWLIPLSAIFSPASLTGIQSKDLF